MIAGKATPTPKERVQVLQERLGRSAKENPTRQYGNLHDKVWRADVLQEAWRRVSRNRGAAGVDGVSIEWIREYGVSRFLTEIGEVLRNGKYHPDYVRRVYIQKGDGSERPLGIPTVADRIVQMAVKLVIEPLFEADFLPCSYGFRPGRNSHQAIGYIEECLRKGYRNVVDVDLKSYFDTIPHERLLDLVQRRVTDRGIVRLIRYWLKAGIMENGTVTYPEFGSPQGGVLSPLLANIYLHEIDREWSEHREEAIVVRYADDMLILCRNKRSAEAEYAHLQQIVADLGLTLNERKTRITAAREGFDFLGFSFRRGVFYRNGKRREIIVKVPRAKAEQAMRDKIKQTVTKLPLGLALYDTVKQLNRQLQGWKNYFRISNVREALKGLVKHVCAQLRLYLRRSRQRKRSQYTRYWPDSLLHARYGLCTVSELMK